MNYIYSFKCELRFEQLMGETSSLLLYGLLVLQLFVSNRDTFAGES